MISDSNINNSMFKQNSVLITSSSFLFPQNYTAIFDLWDLLWLGFLFFVLYGGLGCKTIFINVFMVIILCFYVLFGACLAFLSFAPKEKHMVRLDAFCFLFLVILHRRKIQTQGGWLCGFCSHNLFDMFIQLFSGWCLGCRVCVSLVLETGSSVEKGFDCWELEP